MSSVLTDTNDDLIAAAAGDMSKISDLTALIKKLQVAEAEVSLPDRRTTTIRFSPNFDATKTEKLAKILYSLRHISAFGLTEKDVNALSLTAVSLLQNPQVDSNFSFVLLHGSKKIYISAFTAAALYAPVEIVKAFMDRTETDLNSKIEIEGRYTNALHLVAQNADLRDRLSEDFHTGESPTHPDLLKVLKLLINSDRIQTTFSYGNRLSPESEVLQMIKDRWGETELYSQVTGMFRDRRLALAGLPRDLNSVQESEREIARAGAKLDQLGLIAKSFPGKPVVREAVRTASAVIRNRGTPPLAKMF